MSETTNDPHALGNAEMRRLCALANALATAFSICARCRVPWSPGAGRGTHVAIGWWRCDACSIALEVELAAMLLGPFRAEAVR